jgi:predicted transcriptional regulator
MDLKEYIKSLIRQQVDEMSTTGAIGVGAGPIASPNWVSPPDQKKNAATKYAEKEGWKVTKGETTMPGDSKVRDYVSLTGKKKKKVKIYKESNYDAPSKYGAESGYTKASGYTGVGRDNHVSTYYKESMDKFDATAMAKEYLGIEKYNSIFNSGKLAAERGETENPYARTHNTISRQAWDDGFNSIKKENMSESLIDIIKEELLNEVTYHKFKNEVKFRTKNEQLHKAIREVKRKLAEIDRIVEYTSRMKQELSEGEEGLKYWKKTESNIATISEMVNTLNNKIKNLH